VIQLTPVLKGSVIVTEVLVLIRPVFEQVVSILHIYIYHAMIFPVSDVFAHAP